MKADFEIPKSVRCRREKRAASVVLQAPADYSAVQVAPSNAKAIVLVGVGSDNRLASVHLQQSSGSDLVDEAALKAAYSSTYRAASVRCNAVPGSVTLTFTYNR